MKRLTIPDVRVDEHTTRRTVIDARAVREHAMDFYWRLKAYEDTGLMPDEIKSMQGEHFSGLEMAKLHSALMELKKYQEADLDGRLVVLPCRIGATVYVLIQDSAIFHPETNGWYIGTETIGAITRAGFYLGDPEEGSFEPNDEIGKTVFLTREEAEKALEAMKDD